MPEIAYLSLGANLGQRQEQLRAALDRLAVLGRVIATSSLYETQPVGVPDQPWFLNCAVAVETNLSPERVLDSTLAIERAMGRERTRKKGPRNIDIDIVLFDQRIVDSPRLMIPHPAMHQRRFVLAPLAEIAPQARHPVLKKTVGELLAELSDREIVRRIQSEPGDQSKA